MARLVLGTRFVRIGGQNAPMSMAQDFGLIGEILPAAEIVRRIAEDADDILSKRLPGLLI